MHPIFSRRHFLSASSFALPLASSWPLQQSPAASTAPDAFPMQVPDMVREMVIVSHFQPKRVRELVEAHPALARAAMDWGFGDWEDALGAASHTGNRDIAEYLISRGARPTIFSATMLGQLDIVKAFVAASPGVQRIAGPHSISLLAHAKAGGAAAGAVYEFLERLGDADGPKSEPISDEEKASLTGTYTFGAGPSDRIDITVDKGSVTFTRPGMPFGRPLYHLGDRAFYPAGAAAVRIKFSASGGGTILTIYDPDLVLTALRRG